MQEEDLIVNQENSIDGILDTDISIERCPHDKENPYTMVHNGLIRDASISPECRWLIIYLLSNDGKWKINIQQLINHLKGMAGRDKVYSIINEAINAGYMKREISKKGNLKQAIKYYVSERPNLKKCFRRPCFQDPESRDTENPHIKNNLNKESTLEKNNNLTPTSLKSANENSADALGAFAPKEISNLAPAKKIKTQKAVTDFSPNVQEMTEKLLQMVKANNPVYRPPDNLDNFMFQVQLMLEKDQQKPDLILKTFEWACQDNEQRDNFKGWRSVVCSNKRKGKISNPAEIFRGHFDVIYTQMVSRPKRKFAPSSNDDKSLEKMLEWDKGAL